MPLSQPERDAVNDRLDALGLPVSLALAVYAAELVHDAYAKRDEPEPLTIEQQADAFARTYPLDLNPIAHFAFLAGAKAAQDRT